MQAAIALPMPRAIIMHPWLQAMLQEEKLSSLYVGCLPAIVSTAASGAIFYGVYDILKDRYLT